MGNALPTVLSELQRLLQEAGERKMKGFIKVISYYTDKEIYINAAHICGVSKNKNDITTIEIVGSQYNYYTVKESVETVMDRIIALNLFNW